MPIDPNIAIKTGLALWDQRHLVTSPLRNLRRWIRRGNMTVLVLGAGGVGKTTLGSLLSDDFDAQAKPSEYKESFEPETYWLKCNDSRSIIVAPGQEFRVGRYWPELYTQLTKSRRAVIINVVAFGHHALSAEKTLEAGDGVAAEYIKECLSLEIEMLGDLTTFLEKTTVPLKILTLVTKQDLWWNQRETVKQHYEMGKYAELLKKVRSAKGEQNFAHEYGYTSLHLQNLKTVDGKIIALTTAGYDDSIRMTSLERLIEVVEGFTK